MFKCLFFLANLSQKDELPDLGNGEATNPQLVDNLPKDDHSIDLPDPEKEKDDDEFLAANHKNPEIIISCPTCYVEKLRWCHEIQCSQPYPSYCSCGYSERMVLEENERCKAKRQGLPTKDL